MHFVYLSLYLILAKTSVNSFGNTSFGSEWGMAFLLAESSLILIYFGVSGDLQRCLFPSYSVWSFLSTNYTDQIILMASTLKHVFSFINWLLWTSLYPGLFDAYIVV